MNSQGFEKDFEAEIEMLSQIDHHKKEYEKMLQHRQMNLPPNIQLLRKEFEKNKATNLKSDLKKSNTLVKKIRAINSEGLQQCLKDIEVLNLSQFIGEIVTGILSTTFKSNDVGNMVKLCTSLHQKYEEFTEPLITGLKQSLLMPSSSNEDDTNSSEIGKRKRIQIRLLIELFQQGVFSEEDFFVNLFKSLCGKNKSVQGKQVTDLLGISTFVKYGFECLMGYFPRKIHDLLSRMGKSLNDLPIRLLASQKVCAELKSSLSNIYQQLSFDLVKAHKEYRNRESRMEKDRLIHGSITEQKQQELDNSKRTFEKLLSVVTSLSECTGEPVPTLEIEKEEEDASTGLSVWEGSNSSSLSVPVNQNDTSNFGLYGDIESCSFYEDLPDLLSSLPLAVLGLNPEQAEVLKGQIEKTKANRLALRSNNASASTVTLQEESVDVSFSNGNEDERVGAMTDAEGALDLLDPSPEYSTDGTVIEIVESESQLPGGDNPLEPEVVGVDISRAAKLDNLLNEKLLDCTTKSKADEFCSSFCYLQTKNARKKLVAALLRLPRSRPELCPTYARIVASLSPLFTDIAEQVQDGLNKEFYGMLKSRNQLYIENKLKNVRFQGELIKFGVFPPIVVFKMFKALLSDFSLHSIELLSVLLESCGRFLYLIPFTHDRMNEVLETMLRLRRAKNIDLRQQTMLESAYFSVKPPERTSQKAKKNLTIVQKYIRYLITQKLDEALYSGNATAIVDNVIKSLRRLPWNPVALQESNKKIEENESTSADKDENVQLHVVKAVLKVYRTKYISIPNVADCISGLSSYYPNTLIQLVDYVLEEVQRGLESPFKREPQRLIGAVRLMGELYNYSAVSSAVIFDLLYQIIHYGHSELIFNETDSSHTTTPKLLTQYKYDARIPSDFDPPNDLFRAQLVCEILNTCGIYYVRGHAREKLNRFLVYFQFYLLTKQYIPLHVEFTLLDTFDHLEELGKTSLCESTKGNDTKNYKSHTKDGDTVTCFPRYDTMEAVLEAIAIWEVKPEIPETFDGEGDENDGYPDHRRKDETTEGMEPKVEGVQEEEKPHGEEDEDNDYNFVANEEEEMQAELQAAKQLEKLRIQEEDEEFEKALKNIMQESVMSTVTGPITTGKTDLFRMAIPAVLPKPKNVVSSFDEVSEVGNQTDSTKGKKMVFKMLSRDTKGRVETRQLLVPEATALATGMKEAEEQRRLEKQRLKERVLHLEALTAEQDFIAQEMEYRSMAAMTSTGPSSYNDANDTMGRKVTAPQQVLQREESAPNIRNRSNYNQQQQQQQQQGTSTHIEPQSQQTHQGRGKNVANTFAYSNPSRYEMRKPADTLNLDEFLAESSAAEMRRIASNRKT